jgi:hypothetical protein
MVGALAAGSARAAAPLAAFAGPTSRQLVANARVVTVRYPLTLGAGVTVASLRVPVLLDVATATGSTVDLTSRFAVSLESAAADSGSPQLVVKVTLDRFVRPGTYELLVRVARKGRPKQMVTLKPSVVVPTAQLRTPDALLAERTLSWWFFGGSHDDVPGLELRETSGNARLNALTIQQVGRAERNDRDVAARLVFAHPPKVVPAGGLRRATYTLTGDFHHPGTVTGTLRVDAPQLASGVETTYAVKVRRDPLAILWIAFLGVILGFVTRTLLQRVIDHGRARAAQGELIERLEREHAAHPDNAFQGEVDGIRATLAAVRWRAGAARIKAAVDTATHDLDEALAELAQETTAATAEQARLRSLLTTPWVLPPQLQEVRKGLQPDVDAADAKLTAGEVSDAQTLQGQALTKLGARLSSAASAWVVAVATMANDVATAKRPAELRAALAAELRALSTALDAIDPTAAAEAVFATSARAEQHLRLVLGLLAQANDTVKDTKAVLPEAAGLDDALAALEEALADERLLGEVGPRFRALMEALEAAVRTGNVTPEVEQLLEKGRYAAAARAAHPPRETALRAAPAAAEREAAVIGAPDATPAIAVVTVVPAPVRAALASPAFIRFTGAAEYVQARLLQWVLLLIPVVALAWALFADTFVGTWSDVAKVFLWAYALDLGSNAIVDAAKTVT